MNGVAARILRIGAVFVAPLLAACEQDSAAYLIDGNSAHSLTLVRDVRYWWSDKAELSLVVARFPDCQRRHALKPQSVSSSKVELYALGERSFALHQGKNWYVADTQNCTVDSTEPPKDAPGTLIGTFQKREGKLRFVAVPVEPPDKSAG